MAKLRDGAKFDDVAREFSEDKARQGGSLGWKSRGSLDPKFEEVAFGLEASSTGSPKLGEAKTGFGYHIIMVSALLTSSRARLVLHRTPIAMNLKPVGVV